MRFLPRWIWRHVLVVILLASLARAQSYAPETNYHDPIQRVFPVELARVLAWRENLAGAKIKEVTYALEAAEDGSAKWTLRWIDAAGQPWREVTVSYAAAQLLQGPEFYREVWRQMSAQTWAALPPAATADARAAFWAGLGDMDISRMATLRKALATGNELSGAKDTAMPAKLGGQLLAAAVPGISGMMTLDSTLAARGAAWLALTEASGALSVENAERCWAVVLWLARRENAAAALWAKAPAAIFDDPGAKHAQAWWDIVLRPATSRALCMRAAEQEGLAWSLPLFAYAARLKKDAPLFAECAMMLAGNDEKRMLSAHDYSAWIYEKGNVESGHLTNGRWVAEARRDWLITLRQLRGDTHGQNDWEQALDRLSDAPKEMPSAERDPALTGYAAAAPLINLGYREGVGLLEPVATVSARDLLNFGWEISGLQLAGRFHFLDRMYGDKSSSQPFQKAVVPEALELTGFFPKQGAAMSKVALRLQRVEMGEAIFSRLPRAATSKPMQLSQAERARKLSARGWLLVDHFLAGVMIWPAGLQDNALQTNLLRAHAEGGALVDRAVIDYVLNASRPVPQTKTAQTGRVVVQRVPKFASDERATLVATLAERISSDDSIWRRIRQDEWRALPALERARRYERLFWAEPDVSDYHVAFDWYLEAGAFASVKRVYDDIAPEFGGSVRFSNHAASRRVMLALLENDHRTAQKVLKENDSYSFANLTAQIMLAVAQNDRALTAKIAKAANERYPNDKPGAMMPLLLGFLPLWPALDTSGHPDRDKALDYFAQSEAWPSFQWVLAKHAKLSVDEAVRFLGGDKAQGERRLMIAYLRGDKDAFARAYEEIDSGKAERKWSTMSYVTAQWLRADMFKLPEPPDDPSCAQKKTPTLLQELRAVLTERNSREAAAQLAEYDTADKLWAHLNERQSVSGGISQATMMKAWREKDAAARLFIERYPQDARHWQARMLRAGLVPMLAFNFGGNMTARLESWRRELDEIAHAPAASKAIRAQATVQLYKIDGSRVRVDGSPEERRAMAERIATLLREFGDEPQAAELNLLLADLLLPIDEPAADAALEKAAQSSNKTVAYQAETRLRQRALAGKPLVLKFTAVDGQEVDLEKLRGKTVLVDVWATWCQPCVEEMPRIIALHKTYQPQGLELIGISLDRDRDALAAFLKKHDMPWPQHCDGRGWQNEFAVRWGITSVPAKLLVDKAGRVTILKSGDDLEAEVKKRLAQ